MLLADYEIEALADYLASDRSLESTLAILHDRLRVVIDGPGPDAKDPNTCPDCQGSGRWKFHGDEPCEYEEDVWHCEDGQLVQGEGDGS